MLPNLNLDDKTFKNLVHEAIAYLNNQNAEWTDFNDHDPGVTFVELFAWLTEMQRYYLNRVTHKNEEKFLALLGLEKSKPVSAVSRVQFSEVAEDYFLLQNFKVQAGNRVYETGEGCWLYANRIEKAVVFENGLYTDRSEENQHIKMNFYPFGKKIRRGNALYLSFEKPLEACKMMSLSVGLEHVYDSSVMNAYLSLLSKFELKIKWFYFDEIQSTWCDLKCIEDGTRGFLFKGAVKVEHNGTMGRTTLIGDVTARYWIKAEVQEDYFEMAPSVVGIFLNQKMVKHEHSYFVCTDYLEKDKTVTCNHYLERYGHVFVQKKVDTGHWVDIAAYSGEDFSLVGASLSNEGTQPIRVIASLKPFEFIGKSNGLPNQTFQLDYDNIIHNTIRIEVGETLGTGADASQVYWEEWTEVDSFDYVKAKDKVFVIDYDKNTLCFGDNIHGAILPKRMDKIRIIALKCGAGLFGNINQSKINRFYDGKMDFTEICYEETLKQMRLTNVVPATGGTDEERLNTLKQRMHRQLNLTKRAVTASDYTQIMLNNPLVTINRVQMIPYYNPMSKGCLVEENEGHMAIAVIPKLDVMPPVPSALLIESLETYLETFRLIGTKVHVIAPRYIKVTVQADIIVADRFNFDKRKVVDVLNVLISPYVQKEGVGGWPFGKKVSVSAISNEISKVKDVLYVKEVTLNAVGERITYSEQGEIVLDLDSMVYSGEHEVVLLEK